MSKNGYHKNPALNEVTKLAVSLGWTQKDATDHGGYRLLCPEKECYERVYSTPNNPEGAASHIRDTIISCRHSPRVKDAIKQCSEYLDEAEEKITAAERLMQSQGLMRQAESEKQKITSLLDEAAKLESLGMDTLAIYGISGDSIPAIAKSAKKSVNKASKELSSLPIINEEISRSKCQISSMRGRIKRAQKGIDQP